MKNAKLTINMILVGLACLTAIFLILQAMSGNIEGAIVGWANMQIPFWVGLPAGIITIGIIIYMIFKGPIDDFINNFDLSRGSL